MTGRMEFDVRFPEPEERRIPKRGSPVSIRLIVLADLCGHRDPGAASKRAPRVIRMAGFEQAMTQLTPRMPIALAPIGEQHEIIGFSKLVDFHPDRLLTDLSLFAAPRELRARLVDPETFAETVRQMGDELGAPPTPPPAAEPPPPEPAGEESRADMLNRLLGKRPAEPGDGAETASVQSMASDFIRSVVAPYIRPVADPRREEYVAAVDSAISQLMRALLEDRAFRSLEATWRSIYQLLSWIEASSDVSVELVDLPARDLEGDFGGAGSGIEVSRVYRALASGATNDAWTVIVADYALGDTEEGVLGLRGLGRLASRLGGHVLATAPPSLLGVTSIHRPEDAPLPVHDRSPEARDRWDTLRSSREASHIGLAMPGILLRLPYGARGAKVKSFDFEEIPDPEPSRFLWGNPAYAMAALLIRKALGMATVGEALEIGDLPAYTYPREGESRFLPCAETLLSEADAQAILEVGVNPVLGFSNRNSVAFLGFRTLSDPPAWISPPKA